MHLRPTSKLGYFSFNKSKPIYFMPTPSVLMSTISVCTGFYTFFTFHYSKSDLVKQNVLLIANH